MHVTRRFTDANTNATNCTSQGQRTLALITAADAQATYVQSIRRTHTRKLILSITADVKYAYFSYFSYTPHCEEKNQLSQDSGIEYG